MYSLKQLLMEAGNKINRKKPFSLSVSDPYMYYWETTGQHDNPQGGVWMSKKKSISITEPWHNLSVTLSPEAYIEASKKLWANPMLSTAYQLDWSGEGVASAADDADVNASAAKDAKKNTDALNKRLKAYNDEFGKQNKKIDISQLKPVEAGSSAQFTPKILTKLNNGWMQIEIPWGSSKKMTKYWTRSKWFTNGSYNYKDGARSYKVYWMTPKEDQVDIETLKSMNRKTVF